MASTAQEKAIKENVRSISDDVLQSAEEAVATTRDVADEKLDKAQDKIREWRGDVDPTIEELAAKVQEYTQRGLALAYDAKVKAQQTYEQYCDATGKYVAEKPAKSLLIAAAAGALIGAMFVSSRRNPPRY